MNKPSTCIGLNMYSVREHCKTPDDLDRTLGKLKDLGYQNFQISGISLEPEKVRELLDKHGVFCCATHEGLGALKDNLQAVMKKMRTLGCTFTALGFPGDENLNAEGAARLPAILDGIGAQLRAEGFEFGYHNHSLEFEKFNGKTFFQTIYDNTNPKNVMAELDTYWVQHGGGCPEQWILRLKGRLPVIHLKDYVILRRNPVLCEIGAGNLEWDLILKACKKAAVKWYLVEQDDPFDNRDIFESLGRSIAYLKKMGMK